MARWSWWQRRFILRAYALTLTEGDKDFFRTVVKMGKENKVISESIRAIKGDK